MMESDGFMQLSMWLFPVSRCQQRFGKLVQTFGPQHSVSCWDTVSLVLADHVMLEESVGGLFLILFNA
jgi:hypothetical protein